MLILPVLFISIVLCNAGASWFSYSNKNQENVTDKRVLGSLSAGFICTAALLCAKWILEGYAPMVTMDGILLVLTFSLLGALLLGQIKLNVPILTTLFIPFIFLLSLLAFIASFHSKALIDPRLMSLGMAFHIFFIFLGFAHYTLGFGVGVAFWVQEGQIKQHRIRNWAYRLPSLESLENLTVFYIALGFVFWTAGLALGVIQAFLVFDHLPLTDPKILGSMMVMLIYAAFFLLRWGLRMRGRKTMALVMAGYLLALFTFVGVRVFLSTFHAF